MKAITTTALFFLIGFYLSVNSQHIIFEKRFSPPLSSYCQDKNYYNNTKDLAFYPDNSILILGNMVLGGDTCMNTASNVALRIFKLTPDGDSIWTKIYSEPQNNPSFGTYLIGNSICNTSDNNFIISGEVEPGSISLVDAYLLKMDQSGNVL